MKTPTDSCKNEARWTEDDLRRNAWMKGEHFYCLQSRNTYIGFQGRGYASASGTPCSRLFARRPARRGVPPERPTARHSAAQRDLHWCWTGVSGWGGAPRGCPGGTGSGGATWKAEEQGDTGEVKLSSYRSGLRLVFQQGCLRASEAWQPMPSERGTAAFPDLTFLQLVFGYRTLEELRYAFVDCWVEHDDTQAALEALFSR